MAGRADATDDVHRLRDIVVEEVSLVDRAANKRRFLVVKRSNEMLDGNETDDTRTDDAATGDVEKAKKKPAAPNAEEVDETKRKKPEDKDETDDAEKAARPPEDDEGDGEDEEEEDTEKASSSKVGANDDNEDEEEPEKKKRKKAALTLSGAEKGTLLNGLAHELERLMSVAKQVKDATEVEAAAGVPPKLAREVSAIVDRLSGLMGAGSPTAKKTEVTKGARMAKERLDRFQKALSLLADILKELTESKEMSPAPTAGSAEAGVKKTENNGNDPATVSGLTELVKGIGELTKVVKRQEEELGRIRQTRGVSNAIQVDGGGRRAEPADVSWPLDMNRPINREQVKKEVSFFDE